MKFRPSFQIRVFSLQIDLSLLILIKDQGSSHGIFREILKFYLKFPSLLSDQSIFPSSWSVTTNSDQEPGKQSLKFKKKKIRFSSPLSDKSIFPSSWSVPIDSDQEAGKYSWKFHKNLKIFWGVSSIFSDQWSKWLSTWSVSSRIRENLSHFYVH